MSLNMDCNNSHALSNSTDNVTSNCPLNTTTKGPWHNPPFEVSASNITLALVLVTLDVVTIFGNLLVLVSFYVERRLLQPFNLFIMNLAVTDFLVAITAMTFYTLDTLLGYWPFGRAMCAVWIYFDFAMTFSSVFTLVAISVDRFWCVTWAMHYKKHNNRNKTAIILAFIWVCVFLIWTPPFIADRMERFDAHYCIWEPSENTEFVIFVAVVGHYIPCVIMVFCYIKVFVVMKRQASLIAANTSVLRPTGSNTAPRSAFNSHSAAGVQENSTENSSQITRIVPGQRENGTIRLSPAHFSNPRSTATDSVDVRTSHSRERRIFITLTYVLSSYLICWFPFYIAFDTYAWRPELVPSGLYTSFFWLTYVNSTLNPFIYAYTSKDFRRAFLKVLKSLYKCKA